MTDYIIWGLFLVILAGQALPVDWFRRLEEQDYRCHRASEVRKARARRLPRFKRKR